jgi:hypothetical protein
LAGFQILGVYSKRLCLGILKKENLSAIMFCIKNSRRKDTTFFKIQQYETDNLFDL